MVRSLNQRRRDKARPTQAVVNVGRDLSPRLHFVGWVYSPTTRGKWWASTPTLQRIDCSHVSTARPRDVPLAAHSLLPRHQLEESDSIALEESFVGQLLPNILPETGRRLNRYDFAPGAAQRRMAERRIVVELRELQSFLERLERSLEFFISGGHGNLLMVCVKLAVSN